MREPDAPVFEYPSPATKESGLVQGIQYTNSDGYRDYAPTSPTTNLHLKFPGDYMAHFYADGSVDLIEGDCLRASHTLSDEELQDFINQFSYIKEFRKWDKEQDEITPEDEAAVLARVGKHNRSAKEEVVIKREAIRTKALERLLENCKLATYSCLGCSERIYEYFPKDQIAPSERELGCYICHKEEFGVSPGLNPGESPVVPLKTQWKLVSFEQELAPYHES